VDVPPAPAVTTGSRCGDEPVLVELPEIDFVDGKAGKPVGIRKHIGRNRSAELAARRFVTTLPGQSFRPLSAHPAAHSPGMARSRKNPWPRSGRMQ